jgi:hypothetical protein
MKFIIIYIYSCGLTLPLSRIWYNYTQQDGIPKAKSASFPSLN